MYIFDFQLAFFSNLDSPSEKVDRFPGFVDRINFFTNPKPLASTNLTTKLIIKTCQKGYFFPLLDERRKNLKLFEKDLKALERKKNRIRALDCWIWRIAVHLAWANHRKIWKSPSY